MWKCSINRPGNALYIAYCPVAVLNLMVLTFIPRATYLAGELLCSPNDMVRLSAILCQITKGDYSKDKWVIRISRSSKYIVPLPTPLLSSCLLIFPLPSNPSPSPLLLSSLLSECFGRYNSDSIKGLIAPPKCKIKAIAKQITTQHSSLEGVSVADAKCWFIKLWSSLELFGMEFLSCANIDTKEKSLIGVSKDKVSSKDTVSLQLWCKGGTVHVHCIIVWHEQNLIPSHFFAPTDHVLVPQKQEEHILGYWQTSALDTGMTFILFLLWVTLSYFIGCEQGFCHLDI